MTPAILRVAQRVADTEAEGPGRRFAIWVQGCTIRCAECCNPEMFKTEGGDALETPTLLEEILQVPDIEGITLLGGEPFEQAAACAELAGLVREAGHSVVVFSGYTLSELESREDADIEALLAVTDVLVDGRYDKTKPETNRRWLGSSNQQIHFFTNRYAPKDFEGANTVEIRLGADGLLVVNGWPEQADELKKSRKKRPPQ